MNQYYNLDNPFANDSELDKMARELNNNKKKLNSNVPKHAKSREITECVGIECLMDPSYARFAPSSLGANFSQFAPGDFSSGFPTPMSKDITFKMSETAQSHTETMSESPGDMLSHSDNISTFSSTPITQQHNNTKSLFNNKGTKINKLKNFKNTHFDNHSTITINTNSSSDSNSTYSHTNNSDSVFTESTSLDTQLFDEIYEKPYTEQHAKFHTKQKHKHKQSKKNSDYKPTFSDYGESLISDISSNYSSLSPKLKNQFKMKSQHLKNYNDNNDQDILQHTAHCTQCKNLLTDLLKSIVTKNGDNLMNNSQSSQNLQNKINYSNHNNQESKSEIFGVNMPELKELLILVVIGIFIIVFIDVFMKK